jgi:hypothetical protein
MTCVPPAGFKVVSAGGYASFGFCIIVGEMRLIGGKAEMTGSKNDKVGIF